MPRRGQAPADDRPIDVRVREALAWLESQGSEAGRTSLARYGIVAKNASGVPVGKLRDHGKRLGRDHALAEALWDTGWYEARLLACFVDNPAEVTVEQMDRWAAGFENWADCDTACFHLFDRTPHAFGRVHAWAGREEEFVKRAAFALLASVAGHDKSGDDAPYLAAMPLVERAAADPRNFVKKGVSWALRSIGLKKSPALRAAARELAARLAASTDPAARWVGKDALREFRKKDAKA